ncbi:hypothetical protein ACIBSV_12260 [Embleya sp. NPDC050154]|uniref:hypothetical protein n=1 Tax=Embleya sp. NPDC050154 TaxID=3363988 RepID=UPI003793FBC5
MTAPLKAAAPATGAAAPRPLIRLPELPDGLAYCTGPRGCGGAGYRRGEHGAPCGQCHGAGRVSTPEVE